MKYVQGQRINHEIFGNGTITKVEEREFKLLNKLPVKEPDIITVEFDKAMLTESEKNNWKITEDIKERKFADWSLEQHAVIIE